MSDPFSVTVTVRGYETDSQGHLNTSVYMQYAEHARWACLEAAGVRQSALLEKGVGPVNLETNLRFHRELRAGDEVRVSCAFSWEGGKTFRVEQRLTKADGTPAADVTSVGGLLDLHTRRLVSDPAAHFEALAADMRVLGIRGV
ncbi:MULTISPECIES: thioesterase family protein [Streptomyces]|uniref:Acyl-CoA thioesterase n=1 Tax=Streptomyces griseocarneus TaxID=51201 RepID=A0ABX7RST7_9ACTN|nr:MULTISPECIES: thioesterase family protein [Streptomyces]QSY51351.1 acyl-CoA thioesterase [Streptomyces griseocarneus]